MMAGRTQGAGGEDRCVLALSLCFGDRLLSRLRLWSGPPWDLIKLNLVLPCVRGTWNCSWTAGAARLVAEDAPWCFVAC